MKRRIFIFILFLVMTLPLISACRKKDSVAIMSADNELLNDITVSDTVVADEDSDEASDKDTEEDSGKDFGRNSDKEAVSLLVHICGAVKNPGVYELSEGDRICHAVEKAGGFTTQADQNYLNQAQKVTDGMRIYIPTQEETALETEDILLLTDDLQQAHAGESGLININTAGMEQLCSLPGIGEGKAQNIIAYREEKGSYTSIEEIMNVEGIKEGLFEKIRDKITVS